MFAQKNYPQQLGNGNYTIAEAGCLLTAICNGLEQMDGTAPDPVALNQFFMQHAQYLRDADGANEDLAWGSISSYDTTIVVTQVGSSALPPATPACVKFHYNSVQTGSPIDHFCWVDHIDGDQVYIIDSWDGIVKAPAAYQGVYHEPIQWAVYRKLNPTPAPTVLAPSIAAPTTAPALDDMYTVVKEIPGYPTSGMAASRNGSNSQVPAGNYNVFNRFNNMINVTRIAGQPGWWINPNDNVQQASVPLPMPAPSTSNPPPLPAPIPNPETETAVPNWRITYAPFRNKFGDVAPQYYVAMRDVTVSDLETTKKDLIMHQYSITPVSGTFTKDNVVYGRPQSATDKFWWYGIPMTDPRTNTPNIELESEVYSTKTDTATHKVTKTIKPYDYVVLATAKVEKTFDKLEQVFDIFKPKKK